MQKPGSARQQRQATLIASLVRKDAYPHPVSDIELLETHISWVVLTGPFAYKIKKALRLDFLDFTTLDARRHYCEEELRLNRRWAPELYLDVVPICGTIDAPVIGGHGEPVEFAVQMRQFDADAQLDRQLAAGLLDEQDMHELAATIAKYHDEADVVPFRSPEETLRDVSQPMFDNFPPLQAIAEPDSLATIRAWTESELEQSEEFVLERRKRGFVRECHGDLHLTNLVRMPAGIVPYDCVEFAAELRCMDVISDLSFLLMDLVSRRRQDLAYTLFNRYLEITGDYEGTTLLGLYFVYHCMIRAKVAAIRNTERSRRELEQRLAVALQWIGQGTPVLVAMHGFSGSGKTRYSSQLLARVPAIRVRSDIERKRLHGLDEGQPSGSAPGAGLYTAEASAAVYRRLFEIAGRLLQGGFNVILDASFLCLRDRQGAISLARHLGVPVVFVDCQAGHDELLRRLAAREPGASEASAEVLQYQKAHADPLTDAESDLSLVATTDAEIDEIVESIKALC